jgi:lipopolysaccharide/colanic/teichoic acid biosynthesis glycosyltransferase
MWASHRIRLGIKRFFDLAIVILLSPIIVALLLILSIALFINLGRPIFFLQERVGRSKQNFVIYKFRSLAPLTESGTGSTSDEERASAFGMFLRDYGLDEVPQFVNILLGDMSLIGPRPLLPETVEKIEPRFDPIFSMRPGLLSLPVIRGRRSISMPERHEINLEYVQNYSLSLDMNILIKSALVILARKAARG